MATLAIIRIRGIQGVRWRTKRTLAQLRLTRRNHLVLVQNSPVLKGMLVDCKDYVAWGEPSEETLAKLKQKHGEKLVYALHPPRKGVPSAKRPYPKGILGNNGKDIGKLMEKMI